MRKKIYLKIGAVCFTAIMLMTSVQKVNAAGCGSFEFVNLKSYCGTPLCYNSSLSVITEKNYKRLCVNNLNQTYWEYKMDKEVGGCC